MTSATTPSPAPLHPAQALFGASDLPSALPACDHYAGVEARMRKSLALQAELGERYGGAVFDATLDAEDGAPVGGELEHALLMAELVASSENRYGRVGARVHPVGHRCFDEEVHALLSRCGERLAYLMVPKPEHLDDVRQACDRIDAIAASLGLQRRVPVHVLVETHGALRDVWAIAAHPRIESVSFGLMDFVSAHRGAIPASGMTAGGQFSHPLVLRAKLEIAAACHAAAKTPSHCVVTEFNDLDALRAAASKAARELGYTRMWSIHPNQIRTIVEAFAPDEAEVEAAAEILLAAQAAAWGPIRHKTRGTDTLHDRASYRYYWHVLARAHRTGRTLPDAALTAFFT
ncbi:HpcH/HpaI aldolase/citrate lyase family protein [Caldimonas brevitalea]|uniref:Aldolase n=1 Tax=Caldimonas brevitalea TaxID=413882 RepID=A0A0G3BLN8_9BURK|nr:aldolase/citrate lyase family protein [Caldimonas brevitalea]AKJ28266.1 aldolase [Caldimonas brevitalea]